MVLDNGSQLLITQISDAREFDHEANTYIYRVKLRVVEGYPFRQRDVFNETKVAVFRKETDGAYTYVSGSDGNRFTNTTYGSWRQLAHATSDDWSLNWSRYVSERDSCNIVECVNFFKTF